VRTLALIYDQMGFISAGLEPPTTWDELRQAAEVLTDLNTGSFGLIVSPDLSRWLPFLYQAGGQLIGADGHMALESPAATAALDFYISIFRDNFAGQPAESNSRWAGEVLGKDKGSMAIEGNWIVPYFAAEFPDYNYAVAPLPSGPGGRGTVAFTSCYGVMAQSEYQDTAFALANFLTSREAMRRWSADGAFMPTRFSLRELWLREYSALASFMNGIDDAHIWQLPPGFDTFLRTFNRNMVELFAADIEATDLRFEMQRVGEVLLNRLSAD
jgi:multiple sugar transport system substrate-binding protein